MLQHSGLENRSAQENAFNIMKIVDILCRTLCKTQKQIKFRRKIIWQMISENIVCQIMTNMYRWGLQTKFPDFPWLWQQITKFPDLQQNSLTFPWLWEWLEFSRLFADRGNPVNSIWCHEATSHYLSQCWPRSTSPYGISELTPLPLVLHICICELSHHWFR